MSDTAPTADILQVVLERLDALATRPAQRFLTIASAAVYADLSQDSIRKLLDRGNLTALRPVKGRILIDRQQLDNLILGSTTRPRVGRGFRQVGGQEAEV